MSADEAFSATAQNTKRYEGNTMEQNTNADAPDCTCMHLTGIDTVKITIQSDGGCSIIVTKSEDAPPTDEPAGGLAFTPESLSDITNWSVAAGAGDLSVVDGKLRFTASATGVGVISAPITVDPEAEYEIAVLANVQTANYLFARTAGNDILNHNIVAIGNLFGGADNLCKTSLINTLPSSPNLAYIGVFFEADAGEYFEIDNVSVALPA